MRFQTTTTFGVGVRGGGISDSEKSRRATKAKPGWRLRLVRYSYAWVHLVPLCQTTNMFSIINHAAKAGRMMRSVSCNPAMMRLSPHAVG